MNLSTFKWNLQGRSIAWSNKEDEEAWLSLEHALCRLLILGGIAIPSTAAWKVTADDGASSYGKVHVRPGHGGLEYHMRHGGGHFAISGQLGMYFPTPLELFPWESEPGPAPGIPTGGLVVGGPERVVAGHLMGPASHPHTHVTVQIERGEAVIPKPTAPMPPNRTRRSRRRRSRIPPPAHCRRVHRVPPARVGRCPGCPAQGCQDQDDRQVLHGEMRRLRGIRARVRFS